MEITLIRTVNGSQATEGTFDYGTGKCVCLEPVDRMLTSDMDLQAISAVKSANPPGKTAIPTGRYKVEKYFSPKHNAYVPQIMTVPGFGFVEIHIGNSDVDSLGCVLLNEQIVNSDLESDSKDAVDAFYTAFFAELNAGNDVYITISRNYPAA